MNDEKQRFDCTGLDLNRPVDSVKQNKFPYMKNARSYTDGVLTCRLGITDLGAVVAGQSPVHSIRRLNDERQSTWNRVIGTGTHLAVGQSTPFTDLDSGYSGDPLALVPWSPEGSPSSFMYVADRSRMRKVASTTALHTVGLAPPNVAPGVALTNAPSYKVVDSFQVADWAQAGTAGAPTLLSAGPGNRVTTTIAFILYDTGSTGWACVNPTTQVNIGEGMRLIFGGSETATVQQVYAGAPVTTTISRITYDSGTTGLASLVLATAIELSISDIMIRNSTVGPENARVLSATKGPNGTTSLRISTTGTWAATNTVQLMPTFRVYLAGTFAAAATLIEDGVRTAVTVGTGTLTKASTLDLSLLATGVPVTPDDYMHITMRVSDPSVITELKVLLDVDSGTNDFTRNYYWRSFRASDLTPAASNLQSLLAVRQQILQRSVLDTPPIPPELAQYFQNNISIDYLLQYGNLDPSTFAALTAYQESVAASQQAAQQQQGVEAQEVENAISQQLNAGVSQWVELRFHISDLIRVGTDFGRTLANVAKLQIVAIVTGSVNLDLDSWYVGGGYGPDTGDAISSAYFYRYRAREILTNVPSNFSPASRYIATPLRQSVTVTPTQYAAPSGTSLSTSSFVIDIERFGGLLPEWRYVGTTPNSATPSFADIYPDDVVGVNQRLGNVNFQPWPVIGIPVSGTTAANGVVGTTVTDVGSNFSTSWAQGNIILINGVAFTIYRVISTSKLELNENAGSQTSVTWRIDAPTILAQPLPCLWQFDSRFFACGDIINPGRLYFSNNDSETTVESNYLDVTSPSEPLMNGVHYNVRGFLWSSENFMQILPTNNPAVPYQVQQIPGGKGLFSRWAVTLYPAPILCALSKDGIYATTGGAPVSLTDHDLYPLFPHEGNPGEDTNGINRPVTTTPTSLRLAYYDDYLYFDYPITGVSITSGCPTDDPEIDVAYSFQMTSTGGLLPITWSITVGALPDGLTLDATTGLISGTPTTGGTFSYSVTATDSSSPVQTATSACSLTVPSGCTGTTENFAFVDAIGLDDDYIYIADAEEPAVLNRILRNTSIVADSITLPFDECDFIVTDATYVYVGGYIYAGGAEHICRILKSDFTTIDDLATGGSARFYNGKAYIDGGFLYCLNRTGGLPTVVRLLLSDFATIATASVDDTNPTWTKTSPSFTLDSTDIYVTATLAGFAPFSSFEIFKIDKASFVQTDTLLVSLSPAPGGDGSTVPSSITQDSTDVYLRFNIGGIIGVFDFGITKISKSTFTVTTTQYYNNLGANPPYVVIDWLEASDPTYLYGNTNGSPSQLMRIEKADLTVYVFQTLVANVGNQSIFDSPEFFITLNGNPRLIHLCEFVED